MRAKYLILFLLTFCASAGVFAKKLSKHDLAYLYTESKFTDFSAAIYHTSDAISTVYMNVHLNDFHYLFNTQDNSQLARFLVNYELYESWDSKSPADTASFLFTDSQKNEIKQDMLIDFDVSVTYPNNYVLKIVLTDLNRMEDNTVNRFFELRKSDSYSEQNFFISDNEDYPIYSKSISAEQYFYIRSNSPDAGKLYIRYYNLVFPLAKPPYAVEKDETLSFEPDSIYSVDLTNGKSALLELPHSGIYHFQTDIAQKEGLTLFRFDEGFPEIVNPAQALVPLRYLTTQKEFDHLLEYENDKAAVDNFWLERASNQPERAKRMITRYYSRVQEANVRFSSMHEGWKTDRGLIFIIYGPPSEVYRDEEGEQWVYGERSNPMSIKFYFSLVDNPFTRNDYHLQRSTIYKSSWFIAVENWRR